jgi:hypothetical protein
LRRERSKIFGAKKRQRGEITEDSDRHCNYRKNIGKRVDAVFNSLLPAEAGANIESLNDSPIVSNTVMLHYKSAEEQVGLFKAMHFDKICHFQA